MRVRPNDDYQLVGTCIQVSRNIVYDAEPAFNQPDYQKLGKIFLVESGILLERGDYTIIEDSEE